MRQVCGVLLLGLVAGCGGGQGNVVPVNGIVFMDDEPLAGAVVVFHPTDKGTPGADAKTGTDGKFVLVGAKGRNGLEPGSYKVTVSKINATSMPNPSEGAITESDIKDEIPAMYSNAALTKLSYSVTGDGKPIEIKLKVKKK